MEVSILVKLSGILCLFAFYQLMMAWSRFGEMSETRMTLDAQLESLRRKKDGMERRIRDLERDEHRMQLRVEKLDYRVRELLPLTKNRLKLATIFFVTPTARRPAQKADLTRLAQTLARVANLYWIVVEDAEDASEFIDEILASTRLSTAHLVAQTPRDKKLSANDPTWKTPRGVLQRNTALGWIRTNFAGLSNGVVYFGDDDNTYDWRLFDEMRTIRRVGVWPVGIVGGVLAEAPLLDDTLSVRGFNSLWQPDRPFPMDMAGFAINISLIIDTPSALFTYESRRGYQESDFLRALNLTIADLEPKARLCTKVYVWHTRTEKAKLSVEIEAKFWSEHGLTDLELDAVQ